MDTDIREVVRHFESLRTIPGDSAGSGTPVRVPSPKRRTYSYSLAEPTFNPIWIAPILLDLASTISMGMVPYPWWASCTVRPAMVKLPLPQLIMDDGPNPVVSRAAESVMTLKTEPGSKGTETA